MQSTSTVLSLVLLASSLLYSSYGSSFAEDIDVTWGDGRGKIYGYGKELSLSLDKYSGSGFQSKHEYLFGRVDAQIKLVAGNSAGTVTTFYLSSQGATHDEIDFEFLGNTTGEPYTLHTNVFAQGKGNKEQQFKLWFDPTKDFHTYSILWNPQHIIFLVDNTPIRDFKNHASQGVAFPSDQPMRLYSSLWNADDWATQGGRVKTDWSKAPFTAYYRNFNANACIWSSGSSSCRAANAASKPMLSTASANAADWYNHELDSVSYRRMRWVQRKFMIYNYCTDAKRFPSGIPKECTLR